MTAPRGRSLRERSLSFVVETLPAVLGAAGVLATLSAWSFGEPQEAPMLLADAKATLPLVDLPCLDQILLADSALTDKNFTRTAVLICGHGDDGALGFVINRQGPVLARSVAGMGPLEWGFVRAGGPVTPGQGAIVYRRDGMLRFTTARPKHPFPSTGWLRPPVIAEEEVILVVTGYAGWAPGQLEREVQAGGWTLTSMDIAEWLAGQRPGKGD